MRENISGLYGGARTQALMRVRQPRSSGPVRFRLLESADREPHKLRTAKRCIVIGVDTMSYGHNSVYWGHYRGQMFPAIFIPIQFPRISINCVCFTSAKYSLLISRQWVVVALWPGHSNV